MASLFDELGVFDRPEVPVDLKIGKQTVKVIARRLSAAEQDAVDAFEANEYGRLLLEYIQPTEGKLSERERLTALMQARPKVDVVNQLVPTRQREIETLALDLAGMDLGAEQLKMSEMVGEEALAYANARDKELIPFRAAAEQQIREELMLEDIDTLITRVVEVAVNVKAQRVARGSINTHFLYYSLYRPDSDKRVFDAVEDVKRSLTAETIERIVRDIQVALIPEPDAPFVSADGPEQDKPGPSQSNSEPESTDSGNSTEETASS